MREVIVCAGAINSPRLLQVSGVGSAALVQALGIKVVHDLPGVGENLRDHYCARLVFKAKNTLTINELSRGFRLAGEALRWACGLPNILSLSPSVLHLFWKSDDALDFPDLQGVFAPASYHQGIVGMLDEFPGMTLGFYQQRPQSAGYVRARSSDISDIPAIQPNYFASPLDQKVLVAGLRLGRRILAASPLAPFVDGEHLPGVDVADDAGLLDYARAFGSTVYHFVGTCRMGHDDDPMAVVDHQLRVHGVAGLRVVDASVMPDIPSGNTAAPVMMIAEKAADMIRHRSFLAEPHTATTVSSTGTVKLSASRPPSA
jgi:choline dehydrogenase